MHGQQNIKTERIIIPIMRRKIRLSLSVGNI